MNGFMMPVRFPRPVLACFLVLFAAVPRLQAADPQALPIRGWLVHSPDRAYLYRVLEAAPRYGINHLELSHDVVMNADQVFENPESARLIEEIASRAARSGIKTYIWAHELNTREKDLDLDAESPAGRAFWESRQAAYERALTACPSLAGVVLMFGSSPTEVWHIRGSGRSWNNLTMPERVRFVTRRVHATVVTRCKKELFVRDFNHGPQQLTWLIESLRDYRGITVISKPEPQDFQPFYPHSPSLGALGGTAQILEMDLNGEYWGQSLIPVSQVRYLRYRLRHGVTKNVRGAVGRIDTYNNTALGTPSEINLFAFSRLLDNPSLSEQSIYEDWLQKRYGLAPSSEAARGLKVILARTFEMAEKTYYTQGFWTWKDQSWAPRSAATIDGGIIGKSTAVWDPAQKGLEQRLIRPDADLVRAILTEKAEAVALADANVRELPALRERLSAADYADLEGRLSLASDWARTYQAIASAYWRNKLAGNLAEVPEASAKACSDAIKTLEEWAERLEKRYARLKSIADQGPRLRALAADLRRSRRE